MYVVGAVVENQLAINMWAYFWVLDFDPLVCMSCFIPIPWYFGYYDLVIYFEVR